MNTPAPALRDPLALAMLAAWVNCAPDQLPAALQAHTCAATMEAWQRVGRAALDYFATTASAPAGDGVDFGAIMQPDWINAATCIENMQIAYGDATEDEDETPVDTVVSAGDLGVLIDLAKYAVAQRAALARPRAAVGEQSREAIARIIEPSAWDWPCALRHLRPDTLAKADAILALQSPPAKVEG